MAPSRSTAWWWSWTSAAVLCAACTLPSPRFTCSLRCWSTRDTSTWAPTGTLTSDASSFNGATRSMQRLRRIERRETGRKSRRLHTENSKHSLCSVPSSV
uniref:Putative secreted protein n=1 Tax=Ixodes scapularis TaxID=6945 RepID=A0A4D5RAP5_IXOSC